MRRALSAALSRGSGGGGGGGEEGGVPASASRESLDEIVHAAAETAIVDLHAFASK